jgi:hypothetical protein
MVRWKLALASIRLAAIRQKFAQSGHPGTQMVRWKLAAASIRLAAGSLHWFLIQAAVDRVR